MDSLAIFGLQFVLSIIVWGLVARWWLSPWLNRQTRNQALSCLALPHAFRHVGLVFLVEDPENRQSGNRSWNDDHQTGRTFRYHLHRPAG